jgi:signal transduction histidine kinase
LDILGQDYVEINFDNRRKLLNMLNKLIEVGAVAPEFIDKDNEYYMVNASLLKDTSGKLSRILIVENNITQQKKTEESLEKNIEEQRRLNLLKSRFVSFASHEFRTPLTTVASSAGLIKRYAENGDQEKIAKHADRIQNTVGHMTNLLNDFLSLEKLESGKQEMKTAEFDVCSCISEIKEDMFGVLKENQRLILSGDNVTIFSDPFFLKAILINLISNAIKYSPEGADINVNWKVKDNQICIDVIDQGIGIPEEEQKLMFTRFFRAANATNIEGTGLGLFIVTKYLDLLRGEINFNSKVNTGSTFTLKIPITY